MATKTKPAKAAILSTTPDGEPLPIVKGSHLYLIDGSGYIFRAFHALPPLTRPSDGLPVGAVHGFCAMLWKLMAETKSEAPTHLAVIFDASEVTFRNEIYADYKAHRPPARGGNSRRERFERRRRAAGDHQIRTRLRQHPRKLLPEPPARAGDHRHPPRQIKRSTHGLPLRIETSRRMRTQHDFQQPRFPRMQPLEPPWPLRERRDGRDQRRDADRAARNQLDRPRVFAAGGQRAH